jgi:hypothetical protein
VNGAITPISDRVFDNLVMRFMLRIVPRDRQRDFDAERRTEAGR